MIKKFLAMLTGSSRGQRARQEWQTAAAQRFQDESTRESELAKEREQMQQERIRQEKHEDATSETNESNE